MMTIDERIEIICQRLEEVLDENFAEPRGVAERAAQRVERARAILLARLRGIEAPPEGIRLMVEDYLWELAADIRRLN